MSLIDSIQHSLRMTKIEGLGPDSILDQLINSLPDNIFVKNADSRFIVANKAVADLMGMDAPEMLLGKCDNDVFPQELAEKYRRDEKEIMETGCAKLNMVEPVLYRNHEMRWYSTSKVPLKDNKGNIIGVIGIGRNITESVLEKQALEQAIQRAEKADLLKTEFITNISHELRTPLNGIMGLLQLFGSEEDQLLEYREEIEMILESGNRLTRLVDEMLEISLIHAKQLVLNPSHIDFREFINPICKKYETKLMQNQNDVTFSFLMIGIEPSWIVHVDPFRLEEVIVHLLHNSMHFTLQGTIEMCAKCESDGELLLSVKDDGIGISPENLANAFDPFWQEDSSSTRLHQGAGLGLTICKGLVELMNGSISIHSTKNIGTEVRISIPAGKDRQ